MWIRIVYIHVDRKKLISYKFSKVNKLSYSKKITFNIFQVLLYE